LFLSVESSPRKLPYNHGLLTGDLSPLLQRRRVRPADLASVITDDVSATIPPSNALTERLTLFCFETTPFFFFFSTLLLSSLYEPNISFSVGCVSRDMGSISQMSFCFAPRRTPFFFPLDKNVRFCFVQVRGVPSFESFPLCGLRQLAFSPPFSDPSKWCIITTLPF